MGMTCHQQTSCLAARLPHPDHLMLLLVRAAAADSLQHLMQTRAAVGYAQMMLGTQ
jgi:hypothetical protein